MFSIVRLRRGLYPGGMDQTIEKPRVGGPGTGLGGAWKVIVCNDNHNTFEHVARTLARFIPGISVKRGMEIANVIHASGRAVVYSGHQEPAEHYWEQLKGAGLTMAPLERD
jgi:ATP-dependent Clp protease adaptor protein ClpS